MNSVMSSPSLASTLPYLDVEELSATSSMRTLAPGRQYFMVTHRERPWLDEKLPSAHPSKKVLKAARHPFIVRLLCAFRAPATAATDCTPLGAGSCIRAIDMDQKVHLHQSRFEIGFGCCKGVFCVIGDLPIPANRAQHPTSGLQFMRMS